MALMTTTQMLTGIKNWVLGKFADITALIPLQASSSNQLADKAFVSSSVATATATFRGTYNVVTDLSLAYNATHSQIATALATKLAALSIVADNNDYAYAQIPTADATPTEIAKIEKYKYNGSNWGFEYELNNSGFTAAQWAAINSGATLELMGKLSALPTNEELVALLNSKAAKAENATAGHLASLDANGSLMDSGISIEDNGAYDVTAHNNGAVFASLSALLSSANLATLIPTEVRKGGMSVKFVQSSDNKYVQYRLMADEWSNNVTDWQGVDDEPTAGSKNLVESGGIFDRTSCLEYEVVPENYEDGVTVASNGTWYQNSPNYTGKSIPCFGNQRILIKPQTGESTYYAFVKSLGTHGSDVEFATGASLRFTSTEIIIEAPADAKYINIRSMWGTNKFPSKVVMYGINSNDGIPSRLLRKGSVITDKLQSPLRNIPRENIILKAIGMYCTNINNGNIGASNSTYNGYGAFVSDDASQHLVSGVGSFSYGNQSIACYSGYDEVNNIPTGFLGLATTTIDGTSASFTVRQNTRYIVITVSASSVGTDFVTLKAVNSTIPDNSVSPSKLTNDTKTYIKPLYNKEFFTLGDSLCASGIWQDKLAELTGMLFNQATNADAQHPISYGGSKTGLCEDNCGFIRAKNLVNLKNNGRAVPVLFIENVNDGAYSAEYYGELTDAPWFFEQQYIHIPSTPFSSYSEAYIYFRDNVATIVAQYTPAYGSVISIPYSKSDGSAFKITITGAAQSAGTMYVVIGNNRFGIEVTTAMTIEDIVNQIINYSYGAGWVDVKADASSVVIYYEGTTSDVVSIDAGTTGVASTVTTTTPTVYMNKYFTGTNLTTDWSTGGKWTDRINLIPQYKGLIEYLMKNLKDTKIYWFIPTLMSIKYSTLPTKPNGDIDFDTYANKIGNSDLFTVQRNVAAYYGIPVVDMIQNCGINVLNASQFYPNQNVHPYNAGYYRWAETISRIISE